MPRAMNVKHDTHFAEDMPVPPHQTVTQRIAVQNLSDVELAVRITTQLTMGSSEVPPDQSVAHYVNGTGRPAQLTYDATLARAPRRWARRTQAALDHIDERDVRVQVGQAPPGHPDVTCLVQATLDSTATVPENGWTDPRSSWGPAGRPSGASLIITA